MAPALALSLLLHCLAGLGLAAPARGQGNAQGRTSGPSAHGRTTETGVPSGSRVARWRATLDVRGALRTSSSRNGSTNSGSGWDELRALEALKAANDDPSGLLKTWDVAAAQELGPCAVCRWSGVTCGPPPSCHVVELVVSGLQLPNGQPGLVGRASAGQSIPPSIGDLLHLRRLDLSYHNAPATGGGLVGTIPQELSRCTLLSHLDLANNALTGSIPSALGLLEELQHLKLSSNILSGGIPAALGALSLLTTLNLAFNVPLSGPVPESLSGLANLRELDLRFTGISSIEGGALRGLGRLTFLSLLASRLAGSLPTELSSLVSLQYLNLGADRADRGELQGGLPPSLSTLASLSYLQLDFQRGEGGALTPSLWPSLAQLCVLRLSGMAGPLPVSLAQVGASQACSGGRTIAVRDSAVPRDGLDAFLRALCGGAAQALPGQQLAPGPGSADPSSPPPVVELSLAGDGLTGPFPTALLSCANLTSLDLENNALSGSLPSATALATMSNVVELLLGSNKLQGPVPNVLFTALPMLRVRTMGCLGASSCPEAWHVPCGRSMAPAFLWNGTDAVG